MNDSSIDEQVARQRLANLSSYNLPTQRDRRLHALLIGLYGTVMVSIMIFSNFYVTYPVLSFWTIVEVAAFIAILGGLWVAISSVGQAQPRGLNKMIAFGCGGCFLLLLTVVFPYLNYNYFHVTISDPSLPLGMGLGAVVVASTPAWLVSLYVFLKES